MVRHDVALEAPCGVPASAGLGRQREPRSTASRRFPGSRALDAAGRERLIRTYGALVQLALHSPAD